VPTRILFKAVFHNHQRNCIVVINVVDSPLIKAISLTIVFIMLLDVSVKFIIKRDVQIRFIQAGITNISPVLYYVGGCERQL
jgi:hypothetical protein